MRQKIFAMLILVLAASAVALPRKQSTTRKGLTPKHAAVASTLVSDSATISAVRLSGYAKPLTANNEEMFVTSSLDADTINSVYIEVLYTDTLGRMLHKRRVTLHTTVPPRQTRRATFATWDRQHMFYHTSSPHPRRAATPYRISAKIIGVTITPQW